MSDRGKQYVYNGVLLRCDKGTLPTPFTVLPRPSRIRGQFQAHELDKVPLVNIQPFGACAVTYGSPCIPAPIGWLDVHQGALRLGPFHAHPLLESSTCRCGIGGSISIIMPPAPGSAPAAPTPADPADATAHEVAEGFKWAALGFAVAGVGLAIAGCFFPPLELAAGASFEAALAASASTAFVAADASFAIGVGIDVGVAEVHPSPANQAVVVGDIVGLALGYGIGQAIGAGVSKFGPAVVEAFVNKFKPPTWVEFIESVNEFQGGARPELARKAHELFTEQKWGELEQFMKRNGLNGAWPPNRGFISMRKATLPENFTFDRYGGYIDSKTGRFKDSGTFIAEESVPFEKRALPETYRDPKVKPRSSYRVLKPIKVNEGKAIPWFGQPGKGVQYELPTGIDELIAGGFIERTP